jgi:Ca-activated chloride channel family protein
MSTIDPQKDYYAALGVSSDAADSLIKKAYREKARQYHPDSVDGDADRFRAIQEAYEVLQDVTLRRAYDRQREDMGYADNAPISFEILQNSQYLPMLDTSQMLYVLLDIRPKKDLRSFRRRLNVSLVVDRSTSMKGVRMQNVKLAAKDLLESLHTEDRLSIVAFSDRAEVLAPSDYARNRRAFNSAIAALTPGGGTEIYQGLLAGLEEVRKVVSNDTINHVILLTDGRTYGDEEQALAEARRAGAQNIGISALGIGEDWNDVFLDRLARYGGGVSEYIRTPSQVQKVLREQIQGLTNTVAQRMRLTVNASSDVRVRNVQRATPYIEALEAKKDNIVFLGNLTMGEPVAIVAELVLDKCEPGEQRVARFNLEAEESSTASQIRLRRDVRVTFSTNPKSEAPPPRLLNVLARVSVFQLQEQAWNALEGGNSMQATRYLEAAATQLFNLGYKELGQAAMLEVGRISQGGDPTGTGRKKLRYGTRALSMPTE